MVSIFFSIRLAKSRLHEQCLLPPPPPAITFPRVVRPRDNLPTVSILDVLQRRGKGLTEAFAGLGARIINSSNMASYQHAS